MTSPITIHGYLVLEIIGGKAVCRTAHSNQRPLTRGIVERDTAERLRELYDEAAAIEAWVAAWEAET